MKSTKTIVLAAALVVVVAGFIIEKKNNMCGFAYREQAMLEPVVNIKEPLTVHNKTGSKVNVAFYNKRLKRRGGIMRVEREKIELSRSPLTPYLATSRNVNELGERINKRSPRHMNIRRSRCVDIKSQGHELILTPTSSGHKH